MTITLRDRILEHNNTYRTVLDTDKPIVAGPPPDVTCVVPYYRASQTIHETVRCLIHACNYALERGGIRMATICVVADGCSVPDLSEIVSTQHVRVVVKRHTINRGRAAARNTGLFSYTSGLTGFVDADVWVDPAALYHHAAVHRKMSAVGTAAVTFGLFETFKLKGLEAANLSRSDLVDVSGERDFRVICDFKSAYACCLADHAFVGHRFEILRETEELNAWPRNGWFGPWMLPEMCLGGFFVVPTADARALGGFDEDFDGYGYEETTLVARLMAHTGALLVPRIDCRNIHVDILDGPQSREDKDEMLRQSYEKYHRVFLEQPCPYLHAAAQ